MRVFVCVAWLTAVLVSPSASSAEGAAAAIAAVEGAIADGDYDAAIAQSQALAARGGLSHDELVHVYRLSGTAHAFAGDVDGAVAAFRTLLTFAPGFTLPYTASPKVTGSFEQARADAALPITVTVDVDGVVGGAIHVTRSVDPESRVHQVTVRLARAATTHTVTVAVQNVGGRVDVAAPAGLVDDAGVVRVSFVATDNVGNVLVDGVAKDVAIAAAAPPWWQSTPLWLSVGGVAVVAAGIGTAALVLTAPPPAEVPVRFEVVR